MPANINDSIKFWDEQRRLWDEQSEAGSATTRKSHRQDDARRIADEHLKDAYKYAAPDVARWFKNGNLTSQSTDAEIIDGIVQWIARTICVSETAENRFYHYAQKHSLVEAIAWRADEVAAETGHNTTVREFTKIVEYLRGITGVAVDFVNSVAAAGNNMLRDYANTSTNTSTSAAHNLVDDFKREGQRRAINDILQVCDFLRRLVSVL
jgi:hypothetical protein